MPQTIKTLLFGPEAECIAAAKLLETLIPENIHDHECFHIHGLEALQQALVQAQPSLLIVLSDGAEGMECVCRCRDRKPNLPIFWFSNDRGFAVQSYRFNCAYFSTKPVTSEKLSSALRRCQHTGIHYVTETRRSSL